MAPTNIMSKYYALENKRATMIALNTATASKKVEIKKATRRAQMPQSTIADSVFKKQMRTESSGKHFKTDSAGNKVLITSPQGALGIAQFLPSTWEFLKQRKILPSYFSIEDENHQRAAQRLFMNYLVKQDYGIEYDQVRLALASYSAGSGRVIKLIKIYGMDWENHLPNETKKYLKIILG
jgi:hypothetical protein